MRRKSILILCCLNALVALTVLGICLPKLRTTSATQTTDKSQSTEPQLSNDELWQKALTSTSERELHYSLGQIQDASFKKTVVSEQLLKLTKQPTVSPIDLSALKRDSAFISTNGKLAKSLEDLDFLISLFRNPTLSITLRESALRSHVEASVRLYKNDEGGSSEMLSQCSALIDQAYSETQNSLQGLALQADWFLQQQDLLTENRLELLQQRLQRTLTESGTLHSNQLTCLSILQAPAHHDLIANQTLFTIYESAQTSTIKEAVLAVLSAKQDPTALEWLHQQQADSSRIEQLLLSAIEASQVHTDR